MVKPLLRPLFLIMIIGTLIVTMVYCVHVLRLSYYRIESGSMEPDFPIGTLVIDSGLVPVTPHRAITFDAGGTTVTHVLLGFNKDGSLQTRGIANAAADHWPTPVYRRDIRGSVLLRILLFAPSFWLSVRGVTVMGGVVLLVLSILLWRRLTRAYIGAQNTAYSQTESSASR